MKRLSALSFVFSCYLCFGQIELSAQVDITRMWFTPAVIPGNYPDPVRFEAKVVGGPASVVFEYDGADRPMFDDGTHGDRVPGDGIWTILFQPAEIIGKLTDQWANRPFIGFCKPSGAGRYNIFADIWTSDMGFVDSKPTDAGGQRTENLANFVASPDQLMNFDAPLWARRFYQFFGDEFDFINFVLVEGRRQNRYHVLVKNDVQGLGLTIFDNTSNFGSNGRLKGYNYFPISGFFDTASIGFNHETGHQWINFLQDTPFGSGVPHWPKGNVAINVMGFSIPPGSVGGTYNYTFIPNPDGSYYVGQGNTNNQTHFNNLELYLMGLVPPDEVEPFFVLKDQTRDLTVGGTLPASDITRVTVTDIIKTVGARVPDRIASQKNFRVATIVLSEQLLDPYGLSFFDWFARRAESQEQLSCSEGFLTYKCNPFSLATGGRASMSTGLPGVKSVKLAISGGGAVAASTIQSDAATKTGYATLESISGIVPYGTAVFRLKQEGVTVSEAGVPASPPTTRARVFIDYRAAVRALPGRSDSGTVQINTGIALANPGAETAHVIYTLLDINGKTVATGRGTIGARSHLACFIDRLKSVAAPDFNLPPYFPTAQLFGTLEISADQPLSVLALRGTTNQRDEFLITAAPVADLNGAARDGPIYFPHFVDGGGYTTSIVLLNTSESIQTGQLEIRDKIGNAVSVNQVGGIADSTFRYSIQPGGLFIFQSDGFPFETKSGWVRLVPEKGSSTPVGSGVFSFNPEDVLVSESGIPASIAMTHARIYVDLSRGHNTGLAISNVSGADSKVAIKAYQKDGVTPAGTGQKPVSLTADGYDAAFVDGFVDGLPEGFTGVLDIASTNPFAALTLRSLFNERDEFLMTTFPVADMNRPAPSPVVFPHIADGGGYSTEFILISPAGGINPTLVFYDDSGALMAVGN